MFWQILLQIALIALNAVFACVEIAVLSTNDARLSKLASDGDKRAKRLIKLTYQPARFLATIQVAITFSGFLGSAFAAENFSKIFVDLVIKAGVTLDYEMLNNISVIIITLLLSFITLVFGELVPKRVAMKNAEKVALKMSGIISFISKAFFPLVWLLTASTNGVLRLLGIDPNAEEEGVTEEEIRMMIDAGTEKGTIDEDEKEMIQNVFEFDNVNAGEISTHRTQVDFLWMEDDDEAWNTIIHDTRHSRYPICGEDVDKVVGILNAKDYFRLSDRSRENVMREAVEEPYFVPESVKADALFASMKRRRGYFAVVLDEYGGVSGIVTMNDIIEQIVGELSESDDDPECTFEKTGENTWRMSGSVPLDVITDELHVELPLDEFETLGGLVFSTQTAIPQDGTQFDCTVCGLNVSVKRIHEHLIEEAIVTYIPPRLEDDDE